MISIDTNKAMKLLGIANYQILEMEEQIAIFAVQYNELNYKYNKQVEINKNMILDLEILEKNVKMYEALVEEKK